MAMENVKPSKQRGETFREAAAIVRGMIASGQFSIEQIPQFLEDQAVANDILLGDYILEKANIMGDTRERQAGTEIEITSAMIEAGASVLDSLFEGVECGFPTDTVAEEIFIAMSKVRYAQSSPSYQAQTHEY